MSNSLEVIAAKIDSGERLSEIDVEQLIATSDIISLGMLADDVRRRRHGDKVTFLRVAHVSLSNAAGADPFPSFAGEIRLDGAPETVEEAAAAIRALVARARGTPVSAFSLGELHSLVRRTGEELESCLRRLRDAGLEQLAAVPLNGEFEFESAIEAAARAGLATPRVTYASAGDDWVHGLWRLVEVQRRAPAIRALSPLPSRLDSAAPTTGYEDLKRVSIARVFAGNIDTIQVDWSLYGPKLAQVALTFGADDLDNVPATEDVSLGLRRAPLEEVRRNIKAAAFVPIERNGNWKTKN